MVAVEHPSLVCLQKTKLDVPPDFDLIQIIGPGFEYAFLPVEHTWGGILIMWKSVVWSGSSASSSQFSVSVRFKHSSGGQNGG
jgi:hypothetical protein